MMVGTILFNLVLGLLGFVLTFLISLGNNLLLSSLIHGVLGFLLWFVLAFILRWVLGFIVNQSSPAGLSTAEEDREALGANLDLTTPVEDEELNNLLKPKPGQAGGDIPEFTPLQPPKLVRTTDPEELAKAVRHLKEE